MADRVITPVFRVSYPFIFKPKVNKGEDGTVKEEYRLHAIFPKDADLSELRNAAKALIEEKLGTDPKKWGKLRTPFRKHEEMRDEETGHLPDCYEQDGNGIFMNFKSYD